LLSLSSHRPDGEPVLQRRFDGACVLHLVEPTRSERFISLLNKHFPAWREAGAELNELPLGAESWSE
jgi:hypothetical protein